MIAKFKFIDSYSISSYKCNIIIRTIKQITIGRKYSVLTERIEQVRVVYYQNRKKIHTGPNLLNTMNNIIQVNFYRFSQ